MKWARVKGKPSSEEERINNAICFQEYDTKAELETQLEKKNNIWVQYVIKANFKPPVEENYKKFQERYQLHCGGFLLFYDDVVRNRAVDHVLHMKWSEIKKGRFTVTMYLSPAPMKPIKKPVIVKEITYQDGKSEEIVLEAQRVDSGFGDSVDPPPPPPPPPPTMH